jgi:hypothetical protein
MAKVILLDSERRAFVEALQAIQKTQVQHICVTVYHDDGDEEFLFWGHPAKIYQMLSLAKAHIIQTQPLLETYEEDGGEE